jgi:hypothetical protein
VEAMTKSIFLLAVIYFVSLQAGRASAETDHLLPADRSYDHTYFEFLDRKLTTTPFNYGRIVVRPPFTGEYSISIYSEATQNHASEYHITLRTADQSLWQVSLGGVDPTKAEGVKIKRADVVITSELAELLRTVLTAMVDETRPLAADERPEKIVIEGPLTEIAVVRRGGKVDRGEMGNFPPTTPKLSLLATLITNLRRLCESPPSERANLVTEVTRNADLLRRQIASGR